jgi:hypothetical protein
LQRKAIKVEKRFGSILKIPILPTAIKAAQNQTFVTNLLKNIHIQNSYIPDI